MTVLEIVMGVLLILSGILIVFVVLSQESKGQGLSGVITGGETMMNDPNSRARAKDVRMARITRTAAIVFFVLTVVVNIVSVFSKTAA